MQYYAEHDPSSPNLVLAQSLMRTAMVRLEGEFYRILSSNRSYLDPESVSSRSNRSSPRASAGPSSLNLIIGTSSMMRPPRMTVWGHMLMPLPYLNRPTRALAW
ncbi:hypothetical protein MLD38_033389 [Melastoma candidum]|uniref:Uncharacterized protein n=1 Tax=Melastoma candidum TaxID=119954 RepID=A0ACB9M759_9MYRT|nr:hypothetical protein MLD38_033389 [Melastoma candidum]